MPLKTLVLRDNFAFETECDLAGQKLDNFAFEIECDVAGQNLSVSVQW